MTRESIGIIELNDNEMNNALLSSAKSKSYKTKSFRATSAKESKRTERLIDDTKHMTFEQPSNHHHEEEAGNMYIPENEIINFEIKNQSKPQFYIILSK